MNQQDPSALTAALSKLTREEKIRLLEAAEEKRRRARASRAAYDPNPGQLQVHRSAAKVRLVTSGNGAGKTALAANEAVWWLDGFNPVTGRYSPVPAKVVVLLDHPDKVEEKWLPELRRWANIPDDQCHKGGKPYITKIVRPNGSRLIFMFHEQAPMVFESVEVDYVIADEPPPRSIYVALRRGARDKRAEPRFLLVGTPIACAWMRIEIYDPWSQGKLKDTECFKFGTRVNEKNLADGYIDSFASVLTEKEKRIRLEGEFFDLEGLALAHLFEPAAHLVDPFPWDDEHGAGPCVVVIDPHGAKPHHAVMLGCDRDNFIYVVKTLKAKQVPKDFARTLRSWYAGYPVIDIVVDSLGSSETSGGDGFKSFIQVLVECGVRARATTYKEKSDEDFIDRVRTVLKVPTEPDALGRRIPKLRIFRGANGLVHDIENVQWVKHRDLDEYKPKLDITNRDYLSCLKYGLASDLFYNKAKAQVYRPTRRPAALPPTPVQRARVGVLRLGRRKGRRG